MPTLHGVNVAMTTAFAPDESFDAGRFCAHIDLLIEAGVHGIVLNSGTGEFAYLRDLEAQHIVEVGIAHVDGRVPVTAQTSAVSLALCIEKSKAAVDAGADALMVLPPWLEGPFEAGVMHHYLTLADAVDTTLVLYNIPQVSGVEVTPPMWAKLSAHPNIGHIKDSTGDIAKLQDLVRAGAGVMGGCDPIAPFALMAGAVGWIWGAANVMPHETVRLYDLLTTGHHRQALALWDEVMFPFNSFIWDNPHQAEYITCVKTAASMRWGEMGPVRQPLLPLGAEARSTLAATLAPLEGGSQTAR